MSGMGQQLTHGQFITNDCYAPPSTRSSCFVHGAIIGPKRTTAVSLSSQIHECDCIASLVVLAAPQTLPALGTDTVRRWQPSFEEL